MELPRAVERSLRTLGRFRGGYEHEASLLASFCYLDANLYRGGFRAVKSFVRQEGREPGQILRGLMEFEDERGVVLTPEHRVASLSEFRRIGVGSTGGGFERS